MAEVQAAAKTMVSEWPGTTRAGFLDGLKDKTTEVNECEKEREGRRRRGRSWKGMTKVEGKGEH